MDVAQGGDGGGRHRTRVALDLDKQPTEPQAGARADLRVS